MLGAGCRAPRMRSGCLPEEFGPLTFNFFAKGDLMMINPQNTSAIITILSQWMRRLRNVVPYRATLAGLCVAGIVYSAGAADNLNIKQAGQATQQEAMPLELGKPIERELAGGQSHAYQITLAAGQYLNVVVEQRGIDVVVTLFGPDDEKVIEVD